MIKNPISSLKISSLPIAKTGFLLGSLIASEWVFNDLIHVPSGGIIALAAGGGIWILSKKSSSPVFLAPKSVEGWVKRCKEVLSQFEELEDSEQHFLKASNRRNQIQKVLAKKDQQSLTVISTKDVKLPDHALFESLFSSQSNSLNLNCTSSLPISNQSWEFPSELYEKELILYFLPLPFRAVDMLWLEKIPEDLPTWIIVSPSACQDWPNQLKSINAQLPKRWLNKILKWDDSPEKLKNTLAPVMRCLRQPKRNLEQTQQRLLSKLHISWQSDLENLRRDKFKVIQNRSQWLVAGAVFASPVPSTDLLSVAVVNGLMIQEMGKIWSCNVKPELLSAVARQLAIAALAQGVVEWSGQALLSVAKLHGGTWLAAGAMQSLSAAYLTRVVGTSMADWMALNNGVSKPDLDLLKRQAPQLIATAAEKEKIDWSDFILQSKQWIRMQIIDQDSSQLNIG